MYSLYEWTRLLGHTVCSDNVAHFRVMGLDPDAALLENATPDPPNRNVDLEVIVHLLQIESNDLKIWIRIY